MKRCIYSLLICFISLLGSQYVTAQSNSNQPPAQANGERELTGSVKEKNGEPVIGALIVVKGNKSIGTVSDIKGNFTLKNIPAGRQIIVFSYMGMKQKEIPFQKSEKINVVLEDDVKEIQELVVTSIYTRHKNSFTGAATTYSNKDLKMVGSQNLIQSLKTLDPALNVAESKNWGSDPNRMPDLEIRGKTSIVGELSSEYGYDNAANQPLFILDGMEVEIDDIVNLNMDRVANVTILKDAASTAIYGSKSSNGVIVVETVKPEAGKIRIGYSGDFKLQFPDLTGYNLMNSGEKLEFERLAGRYTSKDQQDVLDALYYSRLSEVKRGVNSYWLSKPLRTVFNHAHNLYIDGGDQSMQYGIGINYNNEDGIMKGSGRDILGANIDLRYRTGSLVFSNKFSIDAINADREPVAFSEFSRANPYYRQQNEDGSIPQFLEPFEVAKTTITNPLYLYNIVNTDKTKDVVLRNNFNITWHFLKMFQLRGRLGLSRNSSEQKAFKSPKHPEFTGVDVKGLYTQNNDNLFTYNGDITLSFGRIFRNKHQINAVGGWSFNEKSTKKGGYSIGGFTSDLHQNPQFSSGFQQGTKPTYSNARTRSTGFYLNTNYSYMNRYLFDYSLRFDGSSVFGAQKMFTTTWAVGLAWNMNREKWFNLWWVNLLKFRVSVGNPGNQNFDAYLASGTYIYNPEYENMFGSSAIIEKFANKNLAWQKTLDKNGGLDIELWNERIKISVDYYHKTTDPLLVSVPVPPSVGSGKIYTNFGGQISHGINGSVNGIIIKTQDLRFSVNATFRNGKSKYINIGDALDFMNKEGQTASSYRRYYNGGSPDDIWAVRSMGIDPTTGREVFLKKDGSYTFQYNLADEVVVGSSAKDLEGVIGFSLYYKGFSASANFRYQLGAQVFASALYNKVENITENDYYYNLDKRALYDRWKQPGDIAKYKAINVDETTPMSSRFVIDENVFTGESIMIGYETSGKWVQRIKAQGITFRAYMNDIFRIASFKEERGIEYPFSKSMTFSVSVRF